MFMYANAFHQKTTRSSPVVEQVGFIVHYSKKDCTPWRLAEGRIHMLLRMGDLRGRFREIGVAHYRLGAIRKC